MDFERNALTVAAQTVRGVFVAKVSGILTVESACIARCLIRQLPGFSAARTMVLDLRGCTPLITAAGWTVVAESSTRRQPLDLPVALLATETCLYTFETHCGKMGANGFMRAAFSLEAEALQWASHWALYWPDAPLATPKSSREDSC